MLNVLVSTFSTLNYLASTGRFFMGRTQKLLFTVNPEFSSQSKCHMHNISVVDSEPSSISTIVNSSSGPVLQTCGFSQALQQHLRMSLIVQLDLKFLQITSCLELKYFPAYLLPSSEHACQFHSSTSHLMHKLKCWLVDVDRSPPALSL